MYTSVIGKELVRLYNVNKRTDYDAKGFFDEVFYPLNFDHEKYLITVRNSLFGSIHKADLRDAGKRQSALLRYHDLVLSGRTDFSVAPGRPANDLVEFAATSGQITDIDMKCSNDEVYFAWFGAALAIGLSGKYSILFRKSDIIWETFIGWKVYRSFLNDPTISRLPGNKIVSWNSVWLNYRYGNRRAKLFPSFSEFGFDFDKLKDSYKVAPKSWSLLLYNLSQRFPSERNLLSFVFSLGNTDKTIGFIPMRLQSGRQLVEVYNKLFGKENQLKIAKQFETLYGQHVERACSFGSIGIQALLPKGLEKYLHNPSLSLKIKTGDDLSLTTFYTYKTWITVMLNKNKQEISDLTSDASACLLRLVENSEGTKVENLIKNLFSSTSATKFLGILTELVSESDTSQLENLKILRDRAHFTSAEDFRYFLTLLKFDYTFTQQQKIKK